MASDNLSIYSAILGVMEDVDAIGKGKTNQKQNFKYRGVDDVLNVMHPLFAKHGIFVAPTVLEQTRESRSSSGGGTLNYSILRVKYTFYSKDGSYIEAVVVGEGMDSGDKASNKAMSVAFKYACFQIFCIPTEEMVDPDGESPETVPPPGLVCQCCGRQIQDFTYKDGAVSKAKDLAQKSINAYGKVLCIDCARQTKEAMEK